MSSIQPVEESLLSAIEQLYFVFKGYDTKKPVHHCAHCVSDDDASLLYSKPLRELGWPELGKYSYKALTTFGDLDDFKRLLPRLSELIALQGDEARMEIQITLGRIAYADRMCRPEPNIPAFNEIEWSAIMHFLTAWWLTAVQSHSLEDRYAFQDVLESLGCATENIAPFLQRWEVSEGLEPAVHLAQLINDHAQEIYKSRRIRFAFWKELPPCGEQLATWLSTAAPRKMLEAMFHEVRSPKLEQELSNALMVLEFLAVKVPDADH